MSITTERPALVEQSSGPDPFAETSNRRHAVGDSIFFTIAVAAGLTILIALVAVFLFLLTQGARGFTAGADVFGPAATNFAYYAGKLLFGTVLAALLAMIIAVPFAIGLALFISHYAPRRLAVPVAYLIDILAAVPSVVYGLWGARTLAPASHGLQTWLNSHLGWIPIFGGQVSATGRTILVAALVLAIMVLPITTAICREVFQRTPKLLEEAALGLGATRWEMIKYAVFPHARSGMVAGTMLGLGRALGETMAVAMVMSASPQVTFRLLTSNNPATIASNIAAKYQAEDVRIQVVLIATGLVLFVFTFLVNFAARAIVHRSERNFR
ncbi:phosphate ABC transporter permease subunit PstC [Microlunatus sp. Gsoil 973]|uniref:phosphate ABC transporter permease subunit PstC n=1 Tax=Microlunatus sp. Gsoil 973 TaxID=2672569 RepID=UPI001E36F0EF|nr:phosphate ABC transporter permease subunit PstC [Microlunatus sp. Gsoil 973]